MKMKSTKVWITQKLEKKEEILTEKMKRSLDEASLKHLDNYSGLSRSEESKCMSKHDKYGHMTV